MIQFIRRLLWGEYNEHSREIRYRLGRIEGKLSTMSNSITELKEAIKVLTDTTTDFVNDVKALIAKLQNAEDFGPELAAVQAAIESISDADKGVEAALAPVVAPAEEPQVAVTEPLPVEGEPVSETPSEG